MLMTILVKFFRILVSIVIAAVCTVTSPVLGRFNSRITPVDKENVKLTFGTVSDIHIDGTFFKPFILEFCLEDFDKAETQLDAFVMVGDNTNMGQEKQYQTLKKSLDKYDLAKNIIMANGNHDTWTEDGIYDKAGPLFKKYASEITGLDIQKEYYSTKVNGYTFIVLGSEWRRTCAYFSQQQLDWLEQELETASKDGKPIFVFSHWPLNGTHGLPYSFEFDDTDPFEGGIGEQSDSVNEILQRYKNIFFINGHLHSGFKNDKDKGLFKFQSIEKVGNITSINVPSLMNFSIKGNIFNGTGYIFEVYDDEVVIRARNYATGIWLSNYDKTIELV